MPAFESKALTLRNSIMEVIRAIKLDGEDAFLDVIGHPRAQFQGFPVARVLPGDQLNEKWAQGENERTVTFTVRTHVPVTEDGSEFDYMYNLTDLILDAFDEADESGGFPINNGAYEIRADRSDWFDEELPSGPALAADISVTVTYSKPN